MFAGVDDDGNDGEDEPLPAGSESFYCDGDGFIGTIEMHVFQRGSNVDDQYVCAGTASANDEADDRWPPDFDDNQNINIIDVVAFKPVFAEPVSGNERFDLAPGGGSTINILDVIAMKPVFFESCV